MINSQAFATPVHPLRFGEGSVDGLGEVLDSWNAGRVMFVVDAAAYPVCGAKPTVDHVMSRRATSTFSDFSPNPKSEELENGVGLFRRLRPQAIVAIGGGSAIDMAKLIGFCGSQAASAHDCILGKISKAVNSPPLVAIPTTAGTGSEATHFAVVYFDGKKYSVAHHSMLPALAIVDPCLTYSMPERVTAATGLDALCQAIESIWGVDANEQSIDFAVRAAKLAIEHIQTAVRQPTTAARRAMSEAAYLAGQAINVTRTTAPHALSYAMTIHFGVPHGIAVALSLAAFLGFNSQVDSATCTDPRGPSAVRSRIELIVNMIGGQSVEQAQLRLQQLIASLGCPTRFSQVGITPSDFPLLVEKINLQRLANNPRRVNQDSLEALLSSLL